MFFFKKFKNSQYLYSKYTIQFFMDKFGFLIKNAQDAYFQDILFRADDKNSIHLHKV